MGWEVKWYLVDCFCRPCFGCRPVAENDWILESEVSTGYSCICLVLFLMHSLSALSLYLQRITSQVTNFHELDKLKSQTKDPKVSKSVIISTIHPLTLKEIEITQLNNDGYQMTNYVITLYIIPLAYSSNFYKILECNGYLRFRSVMMVVGSALCCDEVRLYCY